MKLQKTNNYCIKMTNHIKKYYYSKIPTVERNEIEYYDIKAGKEIASFRISITEVIQTATDILGVRLGYYDEDDNFIEKEIKVNEPAKIKVITGNPERYFVEDMTFEIALKSKTTRMSLRKIKEHA